MREGDQEKRPRRPERQTRKTREGDQEKRTGMVIGEIDQGEVDHGMRPRRLVIETREVQGEGLGKETREGYQRDQGKRARGPERNTRKREQ